MGGIDQAAETLQIPCHQGSLGFESSLVFRNGMASPFDTVGILDQVGILIKGRFIQFTQGLDV